MKRGLKKQIKEAEDALIKKMLGYEYEEVKVITESDGENVSKVKTEKATKHVQPDTNVIISWLKANYPEKWGEAKEDKLNEYGVVLLPSVEVKNE